MYIIQCFWRIFLIKSADILDSAVSCEFPYESILLLTILNTRAPL